MEKKYDKKDSMLYFVTNELSSGMIANKTSVSDYKTIDAIRRSMIEILEEHGDEKYSVSNLNSLIKDAEISVVGKSDRGYMSVGRRIYANGGNKMDKGGGLGDTIADRYARLTKTEGKRLDELSKKVRINEQTEAEDVEWDKLVHKYRGWDYPNKMANGGEVYSGTMRTNDGNIVGKVQYNDHYKTYQVVIDGVTYEEFKTEKEAIENLKNAGFGKAETKYKKGDSVMMFEDEPALIITKVYEWSDKGNTYDLASEDSKIKRGNISHTKLSPYKMAKGGGVHTMPNGEIMLDSAHYGNGGKVDDNIIDTKQAKNHDEVYNILDKWGNKKRIVNAPSWDLETPYSRGWVEEGEKITVILKKVIEVGKPTFYIWSWKKVYEHGGKMDSQQGIDLFEDYENIPANVQSVLDNHEDAFMDGDYKELQKALTQLNKIGYTFEFDLDGQAYDLRPIGTKGKSEMEDGEEMAHGGGVGNNDKTYSSAKTMGKESQDFKSEAIDYVGGIREWNKLTEEEKRQIIVDLEKDWDRNKYKQGGSINAKSIFKEYEENENDNYHAENILLLANNFGTEEDVETAKEILKQRDKQGSTSEAMNKKSYELNKRLYPKLIDALNSNKNQTTMTQEHIDKFVRGANSTDETAREISTRKLKEAGLDKNGKPLESKKEVTKSKILAKKETPVKSTPQKEDDYDCDEIIAEALKRKKNAKKSAEKSANKPEVVKATKKVERTHDAIEKQIEAGKLKKAQIEKIIAETEDLLRMLKKALKSL